MPPPVHEHARRTKTKLGYHYIGIHRRIFKGKNTDRIFKFDIVEAQLSLAVISGE